MKKILSAALTILICYSSIAQNADSATSKHKEFHQKFKHADRKKMDELNLSDDQKAQMKTLSESFKQQMQDLKNNNALSADEQKQKRNILMKEHKEKMSAILTPEQRKQAQEMKHDFAEKDKGKMKGKRFEEMTKDLNLTPEQTAKMKDLNAAFKNSIQNIRQNNTLSQQEKKEQMKNLMEKHRDDMDTLLTDEQKKN